MTSPFSPEPGRVAVKDRFGTVRTVPADQLEEADYQGWTPATEAEHFGSTEGALGKLGSAVLGGARAVTAGRSDMAYIEAARALGDDSDAEEVRHVLNLYKQANPGESFAGEVGGTLLQGYMLGGIGTGAGTLGRAAIEGGLVNEGAQFSEDTLENHKHTAEKAAVAFGIGAALGGGAHAVLGKAAKLFGRQVAEAAGPAPSTIAEDIGAFSPALPESAPRTRVQVPSEGMAADSARVRVAEAFGEDGPRLRVEGAPERPGLRLDDISAGARPPATPLEPPTPVAASPATAAGQVAAESSVDPTEGVLGWLRRQRDYLDTKGLGANRTDFKRAGKTIEDIRKWESRISDTLRGQTFEGQPLTGPGVSIFEQNRRVNGRLGQVAEDLTKAYKTLGQSKAKPDLSALDEGMEQIRAKFGGGMLETEKLGSVGGHHMGPSLEGDFAKARAILEEKPTLEKLWELRREADERLRSAYARDKASGVVPVGEPAYKAFRNLLATELDATAQRAAQELGGTIGDDLRVYNALYRDLSSAAKVSNHAISVGGNNLFSPSTVWLGGGAIASGNPLAALAIPANMLRVQYGNQIAAHVLDSALRMESVARASSSIDKVIADGTKAFVKGSKAAAKAAPVATSEEIRAFRDAVTNPSAVTARVEEQLGDLPKYAPRVASEIAATASRIAAWAQMTLPKDEPPMNPFVKQANTPLSDTQRLQATSTIETLKDPTVVLERMRHNELTPEHVAALRYAYPEIYQGIRTWLGRHQAELGADMSVQQLFQLSLLWDMPLTEAALPANIRAMQATFTQSTEAPAPGTAASPAMAGGVTGKATSATTPWQRLEAGQ